jgi:DNA-binding protein Fis
MIQEFETAMRNRTRQAIRENNKHVYDKVIQEVEVCILEQVIYACNGQPCTAAKMLGLAKATLYKKLRQYGMMGYVDALRYPVNRKNSSTDNVLGAKGKD